MQGKKLSIQARIRRFARFRCTAFPTEWLAAIPIRSSACGLGSAINTTRAWAYDFPERRARKKSEDRDRRKFLFTADPAG